MANELAQRSAGLRSAADMTRQQKAAAVLVAVGPELSSGVLAHLSEEEVESAALEVATLGELSGEILDEVLEEFYAEVIGHQQLLSGGEAHARAMLRSWRGDEGDEIIDRLLASVTQTPFHFLRLHEPNMLTSGIRDEHPQTIALILSHLPAKFAASVISGFEPDLQSEVAMRVATMEPTSPDVIRRVETALQARLGTVRREDRTERGGVKELASMLNNSDRGTERAILGNLERIDPELAEQVRELMFVFEDIVTLDSRALQEVVRTVEARQLALALKGTRSDVHEAVVRSLSERGNESLREEADLLGPVRVVDVEAAQTEIVRHVRRLEEAGTITINRAGEGELVL